MQEPQLFGLEESEKEKPLLKCYVSSPPPPPHFYMMQIPAPIGRLSATLGNSPPGNSATDRPEP